MIINNVEFKQLPINNIYYISKSGQIYSTFSKKFLTWSIDHLGYPRVDIYVGNKQKHMKVHRLVWITWVGEIPNGYQLNHKDDNKMNPCLDNLYVGTQKENIKDCLINNHRVGYTHTLCVFDKKTGKTMVFCPAKKFINYSKHSCASGSLKKMFDRDWFKKRYKIIYYKQVENVTTMGDECNPVE